MDGCIICYTYPGEEDWNKKNILTTNCCEECTVVLCLDCFKKIDGKCPICHKQSHLKVLYDLFTFEETQSALRVREDEPTQQTQQSQLNHLREIQRQQSQQSK